MKLNTTKVYYLGDLSDEQILKFAKEFENNKVASQSKGVDLQWFNTYKNYLCFRYGICYNEYLWGFFEELDKCYNLTNALTLFDKNERIAQIQLRIQELNNELIELDEEMRTLTYEL